MKFDLKIFLLLLIIGCALAYPRSRTRNLRQNRRSAQILKYKRIPANFVRARRAPIHRAMLVGSIYRPHRPLLRRQGFEPDAAMSAFATGDTVAAGSYLGSNLGANCVSCDTPLIAEDNPDIGVVPEADPVGFEPLPGDYPAEDPAALAPIAPAPVSDQRRPNKLADDDDDDDAIIPTKKGSGSRTYFPVVIGGGGYPGTRSGAGGSGGGVTAIANSYSTGKGGVATSHATAYGGAPPRSRKGAPADDDE